MIPRIDNRHVERCLSLIVILYGLRWIIPGIRPMLQCMPIPGNPHNSWYECFVGLSQVIVGCWLLIFFSSAVQWIGYFATRECIRSKRCWAILDVLALSLILWAFTELVFIFFGAVNVLVVLTFYAGEFYEGTALGWLVVMLLYPIAMVLFLFYVRPVTRWLLRRTEPA
jgi:hypothetical protein